MLRCLVLLVFAFFSFSANCSGQPGIRPDYSAVGDIGTLLNDATVVVMLFDPLDGIDDNGFEKIAEIIDGSCRENETAIVVIRSDNAMHVAKYKSLDNRLTKTKFVAPTTLRVFLDREQREDFPDCSFKTVGISKMPAAVKISLGQDIQVLPRANDTNGRSAWKTSFDRWKRMPRAIAE